MITIHLRIDSASALADYLTTIGAKLDLPMPLAERVEVDQGKGLPPMVIHSLTDHCTVHGPGLTLYEAGLRIDVYPGEELRRDPETGQVHDYGLWATLVISGHPGRVQQADELCRALVLVQEEMAEVQTKRGRIAVPKGGGVALVRPKTPSMVVMGIVEPQRDPDKADDWTKERAAAKALAAKAGVTKADVPAMDAVRGGKG